MKSKIRCKKSRKRRIKSKSKSRRCLKKLKKSKSRKQNLKGGVVGIEMVRMFKKDEKIFKEHCEKIKEIDEQLKRIYPYSSEYKKLKKKLKSHADFISNNYEYHDKKFVKKCFEPLEKYVFVDEGSEVEETKNFPSTKNEKEYNEYMKSIIREEENKRLENEKLDEDFKVDLTTPGYWGYD